MNTRTYKQYFPMNIDYKIICGHKTASILQVHELDNNINHPGFKKEDFRPMRLSVIEFEGGDLGDYVSLEIIEDYDFIDCTSLEVANYMRILFGYTPNWQLVCVKVFQGGCQLQFCRFNENNEDDGCVDHQWLDLTLERPPLLTLKVSIDADDNHPAETYFITQKLDEESDKEETSLEYYIESQKQYRNVFVKNKKGRFELVTEA